MIQGAMLEACFVDAQDTGSKVIMALQIAAYVSFRGSGSSVVYVYSNHFHLFFSHVDRQKALHAYYVNLQVR